MKHNIVLALIYGVIFAACSSDKTQDQNLNLDGELYVKGATASSESKLDLLFTADDIEMLKTSETIEVPNEGKCIAEIVFNNLKADNLLKRLGHYTTVFFFLDEMLLFDPPIKVFSPISSMSANDLQITIFDDKFFLVEFYQTWDWLPDSEREALLKNQSENSEKRKKQVDVFFKYLDKQGKFAK